MKNMLGVDTGTYSLKFCLSEKRGSGFVIERVGELVTFTGELEKPSFSPADIRLFFQRNRLPKEAVFSFFHPQMVLQRMNFPEMSPEELENALQWETRSLIPGEESFQISWSIVTKNNGGMDVLFAAVPSPPVESYVDTFAQVGIRVEAVEPHVMSLTKGFLGLHPEFFEAAFTLVDVGFEKTTIICFGDRNILLSRNFGWGMRKIWNVLQEKFRFSPVETFEVIRRSEVPYQLREAVSLVSQDLFLELKRSFTFLQAEFGAQVLERVFLSGGGALCSPLREYLSQGFSLNFQLLRPLSLEGKEPIPSERFLAAVGASLWK
ncbi:MAG: pilus assembly protein PilM [Atribacterota bacterium]